MKNTNLQIINSKYHNNTGMYDIYYVLELNNGLFLELGLYVYEGKKIDVENKRLDEGLIVFKQDIFDKLDNQDFWNNGEFEEYLDENFAEITSRIENETCTQEDVDIYNSYIELANEFLKNR